jgi:hypothetical protein
MVKNPQEFADLFGAKVVGEVPDVGGGPFGMARLAHILHQRLTPSEGERPGRPTVSTWASRPKVPMSPATRRRLIEIAAALSTRARQVSPMQVAAQLLEEALDRLGTDARIKVEEIAVDPNDRAASEEVKAGAGVRKGEVEGIEVPPDALAGGEAVKVGPGVKTKFRETPEASAESTAKVNKGKRRKREQGQGRASRRVS